MDYYIFTIKDTDEYFSRDNLQYTTYMIIASVFVKIIEDCYTEKKPEQIDDRVDKELVTSNFLYYNFNTESSEKDLSKDKRANFPHLTLLADAFKNVPYLKEYFLSLDFSLKNPTRYIAWLNRFQIFVKNQSFESESSYYSSVRSFQIKVFLNCCQLL